MQDTKSEEKIPKQSANYGKLLAIFIGLGYLIAVTFFIRWVSVSISIGDNPKLEYYCRWQVVKAQSKSEIESLLLGYYRTALPLLNSIDNVVTRQALENAISAKNYPEFEKKLVEYLCANISKINKAK